jgi:serine phosphatase RsbU (regulator of sigma subunit)
MISPTPKTEDHDPASGRIKDRLSTWISRLSYYGGLPADTDAHRLRRGVLIFLAGICSFLGLVWGISYIAWGLPLAGSIPIGYSIVSCISLLYFFQTKRYRVLYRLQLGLILIFPFFLQLSLGGLMSSGVVIVWSILAPIGALMFAGPYRAIPWFMAFALLMIISGILDRYSGGRPQLPEFLIRLYYVLNIGGVSAIVFFLLRYFVQAREKALAELDKEHQRVQHSLSLAKEVQQNLLPKSDPKIAGLDISGQSVYCDQTGGDYYDFLQSETQEDGKIGLIVGDVSDHGIPSALLMATVRALFHQRCAAIGSIEQVVADVNRHLAKDVQDSGRFVTLYYMEFDRPNNIVSWVNAGHDAAILYDPAKDAFERLNGGSHIALGVIEDAAYTSSQRHIAPGQIILIATDGIWEARNPNGEMFGKDRLYRLIRKNSSATAAQIQSTILQSIRRFQKNAKLEDDMTLVVIKVEQN